jgi:Fungal specific transcription factor domain
MFVNVTHPSQIRDKNLQQKVKAFTSTHNQRRKRVDRRQGLQDESALLPSSPRSTNEEDSNAGSIPRDTLVPSTRISEHKYEPEKFKKLPLESSKPELGESEEVPEPNESRDMVLFNDMLADQILDIYPDTGNIARPYSETGLTPSTAARLRRLTKFYIEVDGPMSIWRPQQLVESSKVHIFKRNFFALSMTEPVIMEAVFAGSQQRLDLRSDPDAKGSAVVLQHRTKTLKMIQERLLDTKTMLDDANFFAIMGMITLDVFCGNWTSFKSNLDGFRSLAALRGGVENLGWQGWFQALLGWAELRWLTYTLKHKLTMLESPTYPKHPFTPQLSLSVSKLPVGLREAALAKSLSVEVLAFLYDVSKWTSSYDDYDDERTGQYYLGGLRLTAQGTGLMGKYDITRRERILCIGTLAYIIQTDGRRKEIRAPRGLEEHLTGIGALHSGLVLDDGLLWAAVIIAASDDNPNFCSTNKWVILDKILDSDLDGELKGWEHVKKRMQRLFWNNIGEKSWEECWNTAIERSKAAFNRKMAERTFMSRMTAELYGEASGELDELDKLTSISLSRLPQRDAEIAESSVAIDYEKLPKPQHPAPIKTSGDPSVEGMLAD